MRPVAAVDTHKRAGLNPGRPKLHMLLVVGGLLLIAMLHVRALGVDKRFHADEALYATFARNAAVKGDWLLHGPLDKPPLMIYTLALSMHFVGVQPLDNGVLTLDVHIGEFAARVPGVLAAILLSAVVYRLAIQLYHRRDVALFALLLTGLSPFLLRFSATAFTDVVVVLLVSLSLLMSVRGRWAWTGTWFILAMATKPQAIFWLPLILILGWWQQGQIRWWRLLLPVLAGVVVLVAWDLARGEIDVWTLGRAHYVAPYINLDPLEFLRRLGVWLGMARWLLGPAEMMMFLPLLVAIGLWDRFGVDLIAPCLVLLAWCGIYLFVHTLWTFSLYDRYVLLALPPVALVCARGLGWLTDRLPVYHPRLQAIRLSSLILGMVWLAIFLLGLGVLARFSDRVAAGDVLWDSHLTYYGIDHLADFLNEKPVATVIYDPQLGWEMGYYLGPWTDKRRVYYPTPEAMVEGALSLDEDGPRYLILRHSAPAWTGPFDAAGFSGRYLLDVPGFVIYELTPPWVVSGASDVEASSPGQE